MAFVLGGTGAIGKELVKALLRKRIFSRIVLIGRRQVVYKDDLYKDVEQKVVNFDKLTDHADVFKGFEAGYCCLGPPGFKDLYKVCHDYVVNAAQLASDGGCKQFHLVSALGANSKSVFLHPKTKGRAEEEIQAMKFNHLFIYRPALLLCDREDSRPVEKVLVTLASPIIYMCPTMVSVPTSSVAAAMVSRTAAVVPGGKKTVEILENKDIHRSASHL